MKVLMISGDKRLLAEGSDAYARLALQKSQVEQLDVFVWPQVHSAWTIWNAARKNHYDVVTAQDPFWRGLVGWKIKFWFGARLNLQVHADLAGQSLVKRALARFLLNRADSIRAVSERVAREVRALGVEASVHVLPVFVDLARVRGVAHSPHPRFDKTILWIGRFEREKDPLAAIHLLEEVRAAGTDAGLVILGSGSLLGALKRRAGGLPVEFPGWEEPAKYLAMADVVLSTSAYESYGASIVEALAAGVPVVAPDVGIAKEAGAIVVLREKLGDAVIEALTTEAKGELKLKILNAEEWGKAWKETLV